MNPYKILPGKGKLFQNCNRTMCQTPEGVVFWNRATQAWYCGQCASRILEHCSTEEKNQIFPHYQTNRETMITIRRTISTAKKID